MGSPAVNFEIEPPKAPPSGQQFEIEPPSGEKPVPILEGYQRAGRILKHAGSDLVSSVGGMADMFSGNQVAAPLRLGAAMAGRYGDAYQGAKDAANRGDTTESMFKSVAVPFAPLGVDEIYDDAKAGNNEAAVGKGISRIGQLGAGEVAPHVLPETMPKFSLPDGGNLGAKAGATGKLLGREVTSRVPFLNRFKGYTKPTFSDYAAAIRTKADPQLGLFNRTPKLGDSPIQQFDAPSPAVQARTDPFVPKGQEPAPAPYRLRGKQIQDAKTVTPRQLIGPERQLGTGEAPVPSPAVQQAKPVARAAEPAQWPPERPSVIQPREFRGRADSLEDKGFQEANREDLDKHGHSAFSQAKRDWFARNDPSTPKGDLITQARQARGEVGVPSPNGSGESSASQEAISRVASEKANKVERFRIDTRSGKETKLFGVDAVDAKAGPYDRIVKRGPHGEEIQDEGAKARPARKTPQVATNDNLDEVLSRATKGLKARSAKAGDD